MHYFKFSLIILILLLFSQNCYAEQWETLKRGEVQYIAIDIDSVNFHNNSLYYNVYYNVLRSIDDYSSRDKKYVTVQSKGDSVGIVQTCDNSNDTCLNALTSKTATNFKTLTADSLLYDANIRAQEVYEWSQKNVNVDDMPYFKSYMRDVNRRIKTQWNPPTTSTTRQTTVSFKIAKDGRLLSSEITQSSGDKEYDYQALKAVKNTSFNPLPYEYKGTNVNIDFKFDNNLKNLTDKYDKYGKHVIQVIKIINNGL